MSQRRLEPTGSTAPLAGRRAHAIGFTLVEMLIVVAILIVLMAIVVPSYNVLAAQNRRASCAANMKAIGQALALFREDYGCFPPDATEFLPRPTFSNPDDPGQGTGDVVTAVYDSEGNPVKSGVRGLGLYTLYYLGAYSATLPPQSVEPRIRHKLRMQLAAQGHGLNGLSWFRGGGYIDELSTFHCPANETELDELALQDRSRLPYLDGWNNYDMYYRRNFWHPGRPAGGPWNTRHLFQSYPPADTVVTWCPYHRHSAPPSGPGLTGEIFPGDQDIVLFADGSVRRMASQPSNKMYQEPPAASGWPQGPIM